MPRTATLTLLLAFALIAPSESQQPQQPAPVFRSGAQLTVETVTVKDKAGRPIEDLTAKDFAITEDGVPQTISFVEFQRVQSDAAAPRAASAPNGTEVVKPSGAPVAQPQTISQISPSAPGDIRYRDRRLL